MVYPWITGGVLWITWLISILLGPGKMDLAGQVIGTDFIQFYSSGTTILYGDGENLYDFAYQSQLEQAIAGPELTSFHAFITPPFLAWLFVPFSVLPYIASFIMWSILGLCFLLASFTLLFAEKPIKRFLWSLTWFPIFAAISFGQNSLMSIFFFSLTYWLWRKDKLLTAGIVSSLLLFKPQMILGIGILWLFEFRKDWKALLGLSIGGVTLAILSFWLMPVASKAYFELAREFLPRLISSEQFPIWHLHSLRGFWLLLLPGHVSVAEGISLSLSIAGIVAFFYFWRINRNEPTMLFAAAICLTIWISPHAMIYDWAILLIPAVLLWQRYPEMQNLWKPLFASIWIATFISGPLTYIQLKFLPIAIQISIIVLFLVLFVTYQNIPSMKIYKTEIINRND
jgi:alpha-1,2-mannosyltransferase